MTAKQKSQKLPFPKFYPEAPTRLHQIAASERTRTMDHHTSFDLERLRLSQDFPNQVGVKKAILTVPVRKPDRQWFIKVHPDPAMRLETAVLELKDDRETYLVDPDVHSELPGELVPIVLFTGINRQGVVFLWPVRLPGEDGRGNAWHRSALDAANLAMTRWVRMTSNMSLGAYEVFEATGELPQPEWPEKDFQSLIEIAFKDHFIRSLDHSVIRRLRGAL